MSHTRGRPLFPGGDGSMNARRLVLAVLCTVTGTFVFSSASALAATNNAYLSQFESFSADSPGPGGLAVNSKGDVYVVEGEHGDFAHAVVYEFGPSGTGAPLAEFKEMAGQSFDRESASDIAVNSSGDLYVIDSGHNAVYEFNPSGTAVLGEFNGGKTAGRTAGESFYAESVAVNASGDVYVADGAREVVDEFSPSPS